MKRPLTLLVLLTLSPALAQQVPFFERIASFAVDANLPADADPLTVT